MLRGITLSAALALLVVTPAPALAVSADEPEDIVASFEHWAAENVEPVEMSACTAADYHDGATLTATCFGIDEFGAVVAALLTFDDESMELVDIVVHPAEPRTRFSDGLWAVNDEILPGEYEATDDDPTDDCEWDRTPAEGSEAVMQGSDPYVEILETDLLFETDGCGIWERLDEE